MFNENLKTIRQSKGFTQAELAIKINVVRQTISKWEKGLSVPDADTLQKIAEVLEVDVSQLLGAELSKEDNKNEVAEQLARINEQMAIKNCRSSRIWKTIGITLKTIGITLLVLIILYVVVVISAFVSFNGEKSSSVQEEEVVIEEQID